MNLVQSVQNVVIISYLLFSFFNMTRGDKKCGAHNRKEKQLSKKKKAFTEFVYV